MRFGAFFFSWLGIAIIPALAFAPEVDWRVDRPFSPGLEPPPQLIAAPVCYALSFRPPHANWGLADANPNRRSPSAGACVLSAADAKCSPVCGATRISGHWDQSGVVALCRPGLNRYRF